MKLLREICRATIAVTFETFDQIDDNTDNWEPRFMTIFVTWKLIAMFQAILFEMV